MCRGSKVKILVRQGFLTNIVTISILILGTILLVEGADPGMFKKNFELPPYSVSQLTMFASDGTVKAAVGCTDAGCIQIHQTAMLNNNNNTGQLTQKLEFKPTDLIPFRLANTAYSCLTYRSNIVSVVSIVMG